ncbi:hypothetical protein J1614_002263 [Plenodomus biglobosus]|nr:hypothetical protein J1614_002263 [Plenodomus biglobosus]
MMTVGLEEMVMLVVHWPAGGDVRGHENVVALARVVIGEAVMVMLVVHWFGACVSAWIEVNGHDIVVGLANVVTGEAVIVVFVVQAFAVSAWADGIDKDIVVGLASVVTGEAVMVVFVVHEFAACVSAWREEMGHDMVVGLASVVTGEAVTVVLVVHIYAPCVSARAISVTVGKEVVTVVMHNATVAAWETWNQKAATARNTQSGLLLNSDMSGKLVSYGVLALAARQRWKSKDRSPCGSQIADLRLKKGHLFQREELSAP